MRPRDETGMKIKRNPVIKKKKIDDIFFFCRRKLLNVIFFLTENKCTEKFFDSVTLIESENKCSRLYYAIY